MRILHATDTYAPTVGGIEVLVHDLAAHQAAAGHDVTVLTRTPGPTGVDSKGVVVVRDARATRILVAEADTVHAHVSAISPLALRAAEIHEEKTRLGVQRLVALLVPVITIVMGAAVAAIVSALLLAMLGLNDLAAG